MTARIAAEGSAAALRELVELPELRVLRSSAALSVVRPSARAVSTALRCLDRLLLAAAVAGGDDATDAARFCAVAFPHIRPAQVFAALALALACDCDDSGASASASAAAAAERAARERMALAYLTALLERCDACRERAPLVLRWLDLALAPSAGAPERRALFVRARPGDALADATRPRPGSHLDRGWANAPLVLDVLSSVGGDPLAACLAPLAARSGGSGGSDGAADSAAQPRRYALDFGAAVRL